MFLFLLIFLGNRFQEFIARDLYISLCGLWHQSADQEVRTDPAEQTPDDTRFLN